MVWFGWAGLGLVDVVWGFLKGFMASLRIWWILVVIGEGVVVFTEDESDLMLHLSTWKGEGICKNRALRKRSAEAWIQRWMQAKD